MSISPEEFDFVRDLVRKRSAIVIETGKEYLVESRLDGLARKEGLSTASSLISKLKLDPQGLLSIRAVEAMTTNETSFFRDIHPFDALKQQVIPLLMEARKGERRLEFWSAASSTGQEAYSLAMLLRENFPSLSAWTIHILATDISTEMVEKTKAGQFSQLEVSRGLPATMLVKYFARSGANWVIREDLRKMIDGREFNLIKPWPLLPKFDIVFLRNVLIYFDPPTQRDILMKMAGAIRPDGYLVLGSSESTYDVGDAFERATFGRSTFYKKKSKVTV